MVKRSMSSKAIFVAAITLLTAVSASAETKLVCENPRREYLVVYERGAAFIILDPDSGETKYKVLVDDRTDDHHVVTAETVEGGPTVQLHLWPYQKMEVWSDGQLFQTYACYEVR